MQEPCENRFCSLLLFEAREINRFLEIYHRDPRKILRASRNSILETRASNLDTRSSIASRIEFRVETVNLHLHGTVIAFLKTLNDSMFAKLSGRSFQS